MHSRSLLEIHLAGVYSSFGTVVPFSQTIPLVPIPDVALFGKVFQRPVYHSSTLGRYLDIHCSSETLHHNQNLWIRPTKTWRELEHNSHYSIAAVVWFLLPQTSIWLVTRNTAA